MMFKERIGLEFSSHYNMRPLQCKLRSTRLIQILKLYIAFASTTLSGKAFQIGTTLLQKKYLRTSNLAWHTFSFRWWPLVLFGFRSKKSSILKSISPLNILYKSMRSNCILRNSKDSNFKISNLSG